jgi:DNA polymerase I-like protein with 3'-5' exonuclease and polymerase domains
MRFAGVSVDVHKAEALRETLLEREKLEMAKLTKLVGFEVNINAADSMARAFDEAGLSYNRTAKGAPSFTKDFLKEVKHPIADSIREIRKLAKLRGTFVESYVLDSHVNGKVYGQFHLLRGDEGGTRSGRFSSSTPNLQNLPSRDDELAPLVRGLFIPDEEHEAWRKYDYSQIEYRFLAHFAVNGKHDESADEIRRIFNEDPNTDYHELTRGLVHRQTGQLLDRKPIKNINFGLIYGMGVESLSAGLGLTVKKGKELFASYHQGAPFAKATMDHYMSEALTSGTITTILGRKSRFDMWEPESWGKETVALPYELAILKYGNIRRAYTHKALNRMLQGSAADLMKKAMWLCWKDGVFDATGTPRLTVHDELDFSDPGGESEAFKEMQHILETAIQLRIPVKADCDIGPDWGHVEELTDYRILVALNHVSERHQSLI